MEVHTKEPHMKLKKATRREFLKTGAAIAGTALIPGCAAKQITHALERDASPKTDETAATGDRGKYRVFSEGFVGNMRVKNRLVRSATMISAASGGHPSDTYLEMHGELAKGGVGLLITGFMLPTKTDALNPRQIHIFDDKHIKGLSQVAEAVHSADSGCKLAAQIGHSGEFVSPSGIRWPRRRQGRKLSTEEVDDIVSDTAKGIRRAKEAGFDAVELHGAHGYLLSSFLSPYTNRREDKYGGSLEGRTAIVREIMDRARKRVGSEFPIFIKLNSDDNVAGGITPSSFNDVAKAIEKTGVQAIDVSGSDCLKADVDTIDEETYFLKGAKAADVDIPIIVTGGNRSIEHMEALLKQEAVDFFGLSRPLIREPGLPNRWLAAKGDETATCISCNGCFGVIMRGEPVYCVQDQ